ncbi:hypothetical protein DFH28DRAFT_1121755 [Melampsora americana]|nr:hypothetical protein DFH28DRAFT_1121755 [Melampsora americana]
MHSSIFVSVTFLAVIVNVMGIPTPQQGLTTAPISALAQYLPVDGLFSVFDTAITHLSPPAREFTPAELGLPSQTLQ